MEQTRQPRIDRRDRDARTQLLNRVRAEFREMPGLRLTCRQAQRLFGIPGDVCERVFAALVEDGTLTCGPDARYAVPTDITWHRLPPTAFRAGRDRHAS
jgi:hypothetical protein